MDSTVKKKLFYRKGESVCDVLLVLHSLKVSLRDPTWKLVWVFALLLVVVSWCISGETDTNAAAPATNSGDFDLIMRVFI